MIDGRRMAAFALVILLMGLVASVVMAHPGVVVYQHDHFIVPGQRIGALRVGMALSEAQIILRSMGEYHQTRNYWCALTSKVCVGEGWQFGDDTRAQMIRTPGKVLWVATGNDVYTTREGLGPFSKLKKFVNRYGEPSWTDGDWYEWWYSGLAVRTYGWGFAISVLVLAPQLDRTAPYPVEDTP